MSKILFHTFIVITIIAFGGMLTFALGFALVSLLPALVLLGPPLFILARAQKAEESSQIAAMRAATDGDRSVLK